MKRIHLYSILPILLINIAVFAQVTDCSIETNSAFTTANTVCTGVGRNQVCYGNDNVNVTVYEETPIEFDSPGDIAILNNIRTLSLSALDIENGYWGIAVLRLLANLDPSQAEDVTMLLYGDVEIEDASGNPNTQVIKSNTYANMRRFPDTNAIVMNSVAPGEEILLTGRLVDNSWVRVTNPQTNITGWIFAELLSGIDFETLDIVPANAPYFAPMQAFYFRGGAQSGDCSAVPRDGIVIQTPEGLRRVTLWVNQVTIDFLSETGSTATLQTNDNGDMQIDVLEGSVFVSSETEGYVAVAGSSVTVKNSDEEPPSVSPPTSTTSSNLDEETLASLDREIDIPSPADQTTIDEANDFIEGTDDPLEGNETGDSSTTGDETGVTDEVNNPSGRPFCPGNSCGAPGQNGNGSDCNGNSCNAKGKNKGNNGNGNGNGNNN